MTAIQTVDITKKYKDVVAVDRLNLSIEEGELFALLGINGAGKTTTIKMLCGLTKPTSGEAYLLSKSVEKEGSEIKKILGVSPQETAIAPNLTVRENLQFLCRVYGFSKEKEREKVETLCAQFALGEGMNRRAGKLSGGWQRRLSLAMALVGEPKILFLDEPTLGLDVIARSDLWEAIRALKGKITVVLTTHYMEEAEALADRIGVMKGGKLIAFDTAQDLKEKTGATRFEDAFIAIVKGGQVCE